MDICRNRIFSNISPAYAIKHLRESKERSKYKIIIRETTFRKIALAFPEVMESPHFEKRSFRHRKKIFATMTPSSGIACVKLTAGQQSVFCLINKDWIYPVPNKWGTQGWTNINLKFINATLCKNMLKVAYMELTTTEPRKKSL